MDGTRRIAQDYADRPERRDWPAAAALGLDVRLGAEQLDATVWPEVSDAGLITRIADYRSDPYEPLPGREHLVERY